MNIYLNQINQEDFTLFRELAKRECYWSDSQYKDRLSGRVKINPLEKEKLSKIVKRINSNKI